MTVHPVSGCRQPGRARTHPGGGVVLPEAVCGVQLRTDDAGAMASIVDHLYQLGHRRIVHIAGLSDPDDRNSPINGKIR
jgi:hypothetical protein